MSLAVKLNAISHTEAGEQHLDVYNVIDLADSTVHSVMEHKIKIKECRKIARPFKFLFLIIITTVK